MSKFLKLIKNEEGATAIEYGLIAALIAVAIITAVSTVGTAAERDLLERWFEPDFGERLSLYAKFE